VSLSSEEQQRLVQVRGMLKSRTDFRGKPLPGYAANVEAVKAEIARLEAKEAADG
jgi:hypothetical protein